MNASTGEVSAVCIEATTTVTFRGEKIGLAVAPGSLHAGKVEVADIGLEHADTAHALVTSEIARRVPQRQRGGNKYRSGSVLVVGGAPGMTGAVCLAAEAAFRADAGYVSVCAPRESLPVVEARLLEAVKRPLEEAFEAAERAGALSLGPGLGRGEEAKTLVRRLLVVKELVAEHKPLGQNAPAFGLSSSPFALEKLQRQVARIPIAELERAYELLRDTDLAIKTGRIEPEVALDLVVADIVGLANLTDARRSA